MAHIWIDLNDHCKRTYLGNDYFVDAESKEIYQRIRGVREKYALYKSGASNSGCALLIGSSSRFKDIMEIYVRKMEESA